MEVAVRVVVTYSNTFLSYVTQKRHELGSGKDLTRSNFQNGHNMLLDMSTTITTSTMSLTSGGADGSL